MRSGKTATIAGVVSAEVIVSEVAYEALGRNGGEVFLVDIMRAIAHRELTRKGINDVRMETITLQAPYWQMEDFGLTGR